MDICDAAEAVVQTIANRLQTGNIEYVVSQFHYPFAVQFGGASAVVASPDVALVVTRSYHRKLVKAGLAHIHVASATPVPIGDDSCRLTVKWMYLDGTGRSIAQTENTLDFRPDAHGNAKIERIDISQSTNSILRSYFGSESESGSEADRPADLTPCTEEPSGGGPR